MKGREKLVQTSPRKSQVVSHKKLVVLTTVFVNVHSLGLFTVSLTKVSKTQNPKRIFSLPTKFFLPHTLFDRFRNMYNRFVFLSVSTVLCLIINDGMSLTDHIRSVNICVKVNEKMVRSLVRNNGGQMSTLRLQVSK